MLFLIQCLHITRAICDDGGVGAICAEFSYLKPSPLWQTVKPYFIHVPRWALPEDQPNTNEESITVSRVQVTDIRTAEGIELDKTGFTTVVRHLSEYQDTPFFRGEFSTSLYTKAVEELLKEILGATRVLYVVGSLRKRDEEFPARTWGANGFQQPIQGVHVGM